MNKPERTTYLGQAKNEYNKYSVPHISEEDSMTVAEAKASIVETRRRIREQDYFAGRSNPLCNVKPITAIGVPPDWLNLSGM